MAFRDLRFQITAQDGEGMRLDQYLAQKIPSISRAYLQKKIAAGEIRVNQVTARKGYLLRVGDKLETGILLEKKERLPQANAALPIHLRFIDEHLAVIEKPPGIPTHLVTEDQTETVANWWIAQDPQIIKFAEDPLRPGIVHRLDTDTSGLMILARSAQALENLQTQFRQRRVHKEYLAIVRGEPPAKGEINLPLAHDPRNKRRMIAIEDRNKAALLKVREARSEFVRQTQYPGHALLRVRTYTGRMHQVRVHLAASGYPLLGDLIYQKPALVSTVSIKVRRQCLHASFLEFQHPFLDELLTFESALPDDMASVIRDLEQFA